jgi:tetratricopeptide (TPR) repeat protein
VPEIGRARELFKEGTHFARRGEWSEAIVCFERAYALHPHAATTYNLAYSARALGEDARALELFQRAIAENRERGGSELSGGMLSAIERHVAELESRRTPAEAPPVPERSADPPAVVTPAPVQIAPRAERQVPVLAYVALGVGAAGIATGTVAGLWALAEKSELEDRCVEHVCSGEAQDTLNHAHSLADVATAAFVVGGLSSAAGVALLVWGSDSPAKPKSAVRIRPWVGLAGVGCAGDF